MAVSAGYDAFYGFDSPAFVLIGFGYGLSDRLSLTLDRSNIFQEFDLGAHYLVTALDEPLPFSPGPARRDWVGYGKAA